MLFMVVERFRDGAAARVYERVAQRGRMMPAGLAYVNSWVSTDLRVCYQVMECDDAGLLDRWIACWRDLVEFEVIPVITSAQASQWASGG
jgi:hypothetical protein